MKPRRVAVANCRRDVRVEADAGDVREQAAVDFAHVHRPRHRLQRVGDGALRPRMHAELAREAVARAGRDDAERHLVERERGGDLVDRAVAAPRQHEARAAPHGGLRQLARVADPFGQQHLDRIAVRVDDRERQLRAARAAAGLAPPEIGLMMMAVDTES